MYRIFLAHVLLGATCALSLVAGRPAVAQDKPYFVTYTHDLEEPGNLEIETKTSLGRPQGGNHFGALSTEFEYGARAWWTTEFYLDGQTTANESTIPTGFRFENRFRPLMKEHAINPVLYIEFENINGADKTILEVVGHDGQADLAEHNGDAREDHEHEGEFKLILSSNVHDWNISENFIAEKNFAHEPWEFGYAVAVSRPLKTSLSLRECTFCLEKVTAGAEAYGGLGDTWDLSLHDTSHYIAPVMGWYLPARMRVTFSPGFGLTGSSLDRVYRVGWAYEMPQIGSLFRSHKKEVVR
ncbi:MAG TPA: hypothetical protein VGL22_09270 [Terracidiphilus sp.]